MPKVVDHLYRDTVGCWFREWSRRVVVKGFQGFLIDFGVESGLEGLVRVVCAEEIGVEPEPNVESRTRSPGSHQDLRSIVGSAVCTTNFLFLPNWRCPTALVHILLIVTGGESLKKLR